jgi:type II secretory pathway pseudopilin PulG
MSLLELLITCTLVVTLTAVVADQLASTLRHTSEIQEDTVVQTEVRAALDLLVEDLRSASYGDNITAPIEVMTPTALTFLSPDRQTPYHERRIAYRLGGADFQRATALSTNTGAPPWTWPQMSPWTTIFKNVTNATVFTYEDAAGVATSNPLAVRRITIAVTVNPPPSQGRPFTYRTSTTLRTTL